MSFDLLLHARNGERTTPEALELWFSAQPNYDVGHGQAVYENEWTDVHFIFEFTQETYLEDQPPPDLILLLNFARPSPFAREAAIEVSKVVEQFDFDVTDPQLNDPTRATWNPEDFISSYHRHAAGAARMLIQQSDTLGQVGHLRLPQRVLNDIWSWNHKAPERQSWLRRTGRDLFLPTQMIFSVGGNLYDAVVWTDVIPSLLPPASHILLHRSELAPRRLPLLKRRETYELIPRSMLNGLLSEFYDPVPEIPGAIWPPNDNRNGSLEAALKSRAVGSGALNKTLYADELDGVPEDDRLNIVPFSSVLDEAFFD